MSIELNQDQIEIRDLVRNFARKEIAAVASHIDETDEFPRELIKKLANLGVFALDIEPEYGGIEGDSISGAIVCEEVAWASAAVGNIVSGIRLNAFLLQKFANETLKERWLSALVMADAFPAFAITEPGAGSDVTGIRTTATCTDEGYVVNGAKTFISLASVADFYLVLCYTDPEQGTRGMSTIVVERDRPGVSVGKPEKKLGQLGIPVAGITFDNVLVPHSNLMGEAGAGFKIMMTGLDATRIDIAAIALGLSQASFDAARDYAKGREQFGQAISEFQAIRFMLADMATEIEAGRWLTYRAASLQDSGVRATKEISMAKLFCTDNCMRHSTDAVQILGGYGYIKEYPVERFFRDAKLTQIYDGTSEIQRLIIGRSILQ